MSAGNIPLISAMPGMGGGTQVPDDLAASSPIFQALLGSTGGQAGLQNTDSLIAANPAMGQALSFMSPGGGLNAQQSSQFGPLFALMMSLQGQTGQQQPGPQGMGG
jgi:hypothetical protein